MDLWIVHLATFPVVEVLLLLGVVVAALSG
jgi:hypothetical protein